MTECLWNGEAAHDTTHNILDDWKKSLCGWKPDEWPGTCTQLKITMLRLLWVWNSSNWVQSSLSVSRIFQTLVFIVLCLYIPQVPVLCIPHATQVFNYWILVSARSIRKEQTFEDVQLVFVAQISWCFQFCHVKLQLSGFVGFFSEKNWYPCLKTERVLGLQDLKMLHIWNYELFLTGYCVCLSQ